MSAEEAYRECRKREDSVQKKTAGRKEFI